MNLQYDLTTLVRKKQGRTKTKRIRKSNIHLHYTILQFMINDERDYNEDSYFRGKKRCDKNEFTLYRLCNGLRKAHRHIKPVMNYLHENDYVDCNITKTSHYAYTITQKGIDFVQKFFHNVNLNIEFTNDV